MNETTEQLPTLLAQAKRVTAPEPGVAPTPKEAPQSQPRQRVRATDRFDLVPRSRISRVGVHRATLRASSPWTGVVIAALATILLTLAGILIVTLQPGSVSFVDQLRETPGAVDPGPAAPQIESRIDPETTVVVLNGTDVDGFAFLVDDIINDEGWGTTLFSGDADRRDVEISAIFYGDEADAGLAKGLGEKLGGISYYHSADYTVYDNQLTVLIGSDYRGPASDHLNQTTGE